MVQTPVMQLVFTVGLTVSLKSHRFQKTSKHEYKIQWNNVSRLSKNIKTCMYISHSIKGQPVNYTVELVIL